MKLKTVCLIPLLLIAGNVHAGLKMDPNGPTDVEVLNTAERLPKFIRKMKGVHDLGVTACEEKSGIPFFELKDGADADPTFVNCIAIMVETRKTADWLSSVYPVGSKFAGVFVTIDYTGRMVQQ